MKAWDGSNEGEAASIVGSVDVTVGGADQEISVPHSGLVNVERSSHQAYSGGEADPGVGDGESISRDSHYLTVVSVTNEEIASRELRVTRSDRGDLHLVRQARNAGGEGLYRSIE